MKPSVGRIVHYVARGSADGVYPKACRAAVITEVWTGEELVSVCVLNPTGVHWHTGCKYDPGEPVENWINTHSPTYVPGTWHWPERVEE